MGGSKKATIGFQYHIDLHVIICAEADELLKIRFTERDAWAGSATSNSTITVDKPELFGGKSREGGVGGDIDVMFGGPTQGKNAYLMSKIPGFMPAFRRKVSLLYKGFYYGNNPYLKEIKTLWRRSDSIWYAAKSDINGNMNGIHILRKCLTNRDWGMGYPDSAVNDANFMAAADTCYAEGRGFGMKLKDPGEIQDFVAQVLNHVGGFLDEDRSTGQFYIELARDNYTPSALQLLDSSNIVAVDKYEASGLDETINQVTVRYTNIESGEIATTAPVHNMANLQAQGLPIPAVVDYFGCNDPDLAQRMAVEYLRAKSSPLGSLSIRVNRDAWTLRRGEVVRMSLLQYGLEDGVFRIVQKEDDKGSGEVLLGLVTDVFSLPDTVYTTSLPSLWVSPDVAAADPPHRLLMEASWYEVLRNVAPADINALATDFGFVQMLADRASGTWPDYAIYTSSDNVSYADVGVGDFAPYAELLAGIGYGDLGISFDAAVDVGFVELDSMAYIVEGGVFEAVQVTAIDTSAGTATIGRGVLDTVPGVFTAAAQVWFAGQLSGYDPTERADGELAYFKLLTNAIGEQLPLASAAVQSITLDQRAQRPYPPGRLRINTVAYPALIAGPLVVDWAHRDRLAQDDSIFDTETGSMGPEIGTTYTLRLYDENALLARTVTGLTGTTYTWATEEADSGLSGRLNNTLRIELESVRDGLTSMQMHDFSTAR